MPKINKIEDLKATGLNVLVEMIEDKKETNTGVMLPDSASEKETVAMGRVINVGIGYEHPIETIDMDTISKLNDSIAGIVLMNLRAGDIVICKKFDYNLIKVGDESKEYRMYNYTSIIGKVEQNESQTEN